jgi:hypothetical protein
VQVIENSIDIARPPEQVFAHVSGTRTGTRRPRPSRSPRPQPVALGSQFDAGCKVLGRSTMQVVDFAPPRTWTTRSVDGRLPLFLIGTVAPVAEHWQLTLRIELHPTGALRAVGPLLVLAMRGTAKANPQRIKAALEA